MYVEEIAFRVGVEQKAPIQGVVRCHQSLEQKIARCHFGSTHFGRGMIKQCPRRHSDRNCGVALGSYFLADQIKCGSDGLFPSRDRDGEIEKHLLRRYGIFLVVSRDSHNIKNSLRAWSQLESSGILTSVVGVHDQVKYFFLLGRTCWKLYGEGSAAGEPRI